MLSQRDAQISRRIYYDTVTKSDLKQLIWVLCVYLYQAHFSIVICLMHAAVCSVCSDPTTQQQTQVTRSSPGVRCPSTPGGCSVPGCRSVWCHSCWWSAAVFRRGPLGPAAPQWTAVAGLWHWLHVPPSPEGTGQFGPLPWRQRGGTAILMVTVFKLGSVLSLSLSLSYNLFINLSHQGANCRFTAPRLRQVCTV